MGKIMIVEKDPYLRMFYEIELHRMGHDTVACERTEESLEYLESDIPDLMILDLQPPVSGQLETLTTIRSQYGTLPIILNSSFPEWCCDSLVQATDRCLIKDSDTTELMAAITCLLNERKTQWKTTRTSHRERNHRPSRAASSQDLLSSPFSGWSFL
jgi:DNA-binding response OmpR family regulator